MIGAITAGLFSTGTAASTNSYESIATVTVGSGGSSSISFSSIPSTYKHLQVRAYTLTNTTGNQGEMTFNGIATGYYGAHYLNGNGTTAISATTPASNAIIYESVNYGHSPTYPVVNIIDILDYANTNKYKTTRSLTGIDANGAGEINLMSGLWMNTAAISSISFTTGLTFTQYTKFALYGIKG